MKHSIYMKFILGYILFGLLCILFINIWSSSEIMNTILRDEAKILYDNGNIIRNRYLKNDLSALNSNPELRTELLNASALTGCQIRIIDTEGNILYDTHSTRTGGVIPNFDITSFGNKFYMTGSFFGNFSRDTLSVVTPIAGEFRTEGYILLHIATDTVHNNYIHQLHVIYMTFVAIFGLSLIILLIFNFVVFRPLNKISEAAIEYAKGNFTYSGLANFTSEDEIGRLGVSLNYMANKLNDLEEDEKKFISNISHDFRSPLTSIKGYIEAMKDGTIPYEMQEKYLDIVLFETERLTKLTSNLLTLNDWDNKSRRLCLTDFNLYEVLRPIIATFGGKCEKKHLTIDLTLGSKDYYVNADKEKIQQVLYNLIDNAIKFSHAHQTINITVTDKSEKIFVSVKDYGIGIPKDSVTKIWDRFYKTDLSRGKDKTGTGLGLSIVKEILNQHDENIDVISTENVGTEFIFSLKRSKR